MTDEINLAHTENRNFAFPAWWVNYFDEWTSNRDVLRGDESHSFRSRFQLLPRLNEFELGIAAVVLLIMQRSILESPTGDIQISISEIRKIIAGNVALRDGHRNISKAVENFLALQFMLFHPINGWKSCARMSDQISMHRVGRNGDECWLVGSDLYQRQFITGFFDGHVDLVRAVRSGASVCEQFGKNPPLSMWVAPWLDLNGAEQKLLLRLERSVQWEFKWVHLDGIFGEDIRALTAGLRFVHASNIRPGGVAGNESAFMSACRILGRLVEHGLLCDIERLPYLALQSSESQDLQLIWRLSPARIAEFERSDYQDAVATGPLKELFLENCVELIDRVGMGLQSNSFSRLKAKLVAALPEISREFGDDIWKPLVVRGSRLISRAGQFVEWAVRSLPDHPMGLPQDIQDLGFIDASVLLDTDLLNSFRSYMSKVADLPDVIDRVMDHPRVSLATSIAIATERASLIEALSRTASQMDFQEEKESEITETSELHQPVMETSRPQQANPPPTERNMMLGIRQIAAEELLKMRRTDPGEYESLKNKFFDSLDPSRRKLLLDVKKRMTPDTFEQHLKHSLIKFMIENPGVWQTHKAEDSRKVKDPSYSSAIWGSITQ